MNKGMYPISAIFDNGKSSSLWERHVICRKVKGQGEKAYLYFDVLMAITMALLSLAIMSTYVNQSWHQLTHAIEEEQIMMGCTRHMEEAKAHFKEGLPLKEGVVEEKGVLYELVVESFQENKRQLFSYKVIGKGGAYTYELRTILFKEQVP